MPTAKETFFSYFEDPIKILQKTPNCALGVVILCFPLLERYLRETSGCKQDKPLNDKFFEDLRVILPALNSLVQAKQFWQVYRNGLLHQGAFSAADRKGTIMPYGVITGDTPALGYESTTDTFYVNPKLFSDAVLDFIREDLATLSAPAATNHEMPGVGSQPSSSGNPPSFDTGTGNFPFSKPP